MCFICADDVVWDNLDWGDLGWVVRPLEVPAATGLTMLDVILQPGKGHDFHTHPNQQETIYVMQGRIEQWLEQEQRFMGPNDAVFIPMDTVHASFVAPDAPEPARLLVTLGPSYSDEGYEAVDVSHLEPWSTLRS